MKRKRHTEEQIIAILKEHEAGMKTADLCRKHGISEATLLQLEGQVRRARGLRGQAAEGAGERERQAEEAAGGRHARQRGAEGPAVQKNGDARCQARGCRSPAFCVRHERAAGVQDDRVRADDGAVSLPPAGRRRHCGSGCERWRRSAGASATGACTSCCDGRASR